MGMQDLWQRALLTGAGSPCEAGKDRDNPVSDGKPYAFRLGLRVVDLKSSGKHLANPDEEGLKRINAYSVGDCSAGMLREMIPVRTVKGFDPLWRYQC